MEQANKTRGGDVEARDARGKGKTISSGSGFPGPKSGSWKRPRTYYETPAKAASPSVRAAHVRQLTLVKCFVCGEIGHYATTCPKPRKAGCFRCGQAGHMARDCTRPQQGRQEHQQRQLGAGQARVFAVGQRDTRVECTLSIFDYIARVLFDTGASHSFIASSGRYTLELETICKTCPIMIRGREFSTSLIVIPDHTYVVILGIDWLRPQHALIDCFDMVVFFHRLREPVFHYRCLKSDNAIRVGVLAHVESVDEEVAIAHCCGIRV
ncbi:uncharacterized protein LOC126797319 [Argentina anserina]|uniref:uncharacterized protein LOC126797319 n=1 Tax=Argentina anserina TaxID=57926 RepID=UPI002176958C|nr:uncharacterized protein LOC126797319 [Potentilla anserina]